MAGQLLEPQLIAKCILGSNVFKDSLARLSPDPKRILLLTG